MSKPRRLIKHSPGGDSLLWLCEGRRWIIADTACWLLLLDVATCWRRATAWSYAASTRVRGRLSGQLLSCGAGRASTIEAQRCGPAALHERASVSEETDIRTLSTSPGWKSWCLVFGGVKSKPDHRRGHVRSCPGDDGNNDCLPRHVHSAMQSTLTSVTRRSTHFLPAPVPSPRRVSIAEALPNHRTRSRSVPCNRAFVPRPLVRSVWILTRGCQWLC
ncbi:hypothetical protein C8T65DRAFT_182620 [Cerioporus squamosus]|nr:hypothetical protein C8T65DRAFT_182620 [Cerioporus squamosus]